MGRLRRFLQSSRRVRLSTGFFFLAGVLLALCLGQYGYMVYEQHALSRELAAAARAHAAKPAMPVSVWPMRLVIPSIHLDDAVVAGTDYRDLLAGPGLLVGSPPPGDLGNSVIAGHRDTFFRHVADLRPGDTLFVQHSGATFEFTVMHRIIVKPTQISVLEPTPQAQLTLVTCYPTYWVGPAPKRLIVQARFDGRVAGLPTDAMLK